MYWKLMSKLMGQGSSNFIRVLIMYCLVGVFAVVLRLLTYRSHRAKTLPLFNGDRKSDQPQPPFRAALSKPKVQVTLFLLLATFFLPPHPWRHMTATLGYNISVASFRVIGSHAFGRHDRHAVQSCNSEGSPPVPFNFGKSNYDPSTDPHYISNLDQSIDEYIARALESTDFTNIVHIILESMREDSFPYNQEGLLNKYIHESVQPQHAITTETITPFIQSLAEHTLSWHTMWTSVPFTHKAMLGCKCSQCLPLHLTSSLVRHAPCCKGLGR